MILPGTASPSILIVEDDVLLGAQISAVLVELRFAVAGVASTLQEALSILEISKPQLALVDVRLPGPIAGDAVAAMLHHRGIPTIILTGPHETSDEEESKAASPPGPVAIPFRPSMTYKAIATALTGSSDDGLPPIAAKRSR
jgi:CheY-like chemotaxis protein